MDLGDGDRRLEGLRGSASARPRSAASCSASGSPTTSSPRSARRNEQTRITVRPEGRVDVVIGTQPSGQGHETSFAQVVVRPAARAGRDGQDHPRRHRRGEGRRRLAFGPLDAPCRDGVLQGGRRSDRARASGSPPSSLGTTPDERRRSTDGRFASRDTNRTFDFLELAQGGRAASTCRTISRTGVAVVTDNEMHDPVFPNGCAICEVEVDPGDRRGADHALCLGRRRRPLHQSADRATARPTAPSRRASARRCGSSATSIPIPASRCAARSWTTACRAPTRCRRSRTEIAEVLSPTNPLGIKAGGEGGTTGGAGRRSSAPSSTRCATTASATSPCRRRRSRSGRRSRTRSGLDRCRPRAGGVKRAFSPPPASEASGGEGSGVGGVNDKQARRTYPTPVAQRLPNPDPSPPLRGEGKAEPYSAAVRDAGALRNAGITSSVKSFTERSVSSSVRSPKANWPTTIVAAGFRELFREEIRTVAGEPAIPCPRAISASKIRRARVAHGAALQPEQVREALVPARIGAPRQAPSPRRRSSATTMKRPSPISGSGAAPCASRQVRAKAVESRRASRPAGRG